MQDAIGACVVTAAPAPREDPDGDLSVLSYRTRYLAQNLAQRPTWTAADVIVTSGRVYPITLQAARRDLAALHAAGLLTLGADDVYTVVGGR